MLHTDWRNIGKSQVPILVPYLSNDASSPWIIQSGTFSQAKHRGAYFSGIIWSIQDPKGFVSWPRLTSLTVMTLLLWMQVPLDIMAKKMEAAKRRRQNTPNIIRSRAWERTWKILLKRFLWTGSSTFHCSSSPFALCPSFARFLSCTRISSPPIPSTTCSAIWSGKKATWARILWWENT